MLSRRTVLIGAACSALSFAALAAEQSPRDFVTAIYATYKGKDSKGIILGKAATIRRYFEPALAAKMIKDQTAAAKRSEVGALDGDPFIDAQDWEIKDFDIAVADTAPGKASATVKFTNFDKAKTVLLDLVKVKNEWRVEDITWRRDGKDETLRALFR
ncbi:MAG TPA: DUF3828 domain-containing protein [Pseudolabrys sp.]|nr:DUF3828 domain-containing protein [Pseudolabrys sp.]